MNDGDVRPMDESGGDALQSQMDAPHRHAVKKGLRAIRGDREQIKLPPSWQNLPITEVLQV
jgi:hypothetical protein